jgi:hypothetical protein
MTDDGALDEPKKILVALEPLRADGWQIEVAPEGSDRVGFSLSHPLSSQSAFSLRVGSSVDSVLKRILGSRDVAVVARAPKSAPHATLLGNIRCAAQVGEWPAAVLPRLAVALYASEVVTRDEMDWLGEAGATASPFDDL